MGVIGAMLPNSEVDWQISRPFAELLHALGLSSSSDDHGIAEIYRLFVAAHGQLGNGHVVLDPLTLQVLFASAPFCSMIGRPLELLRREPSFLSLATEATLGALREGLDTAGGEPFSFTLLRDTGGEAAICGVAYRVKLSQDERILLSTRDMTACTELERELSMLREQAELILHGAADGFTIQDRSGRYIFANEAAARMAGYASARAMTRTSIERMIQRSAITDEEGRPVRREDLPGMRALAGETAPSRVIRYQDLVANEVRWLLVKAMPVLGPDGAPRLAVNVFHDITELKRAEVALREKEELYRTLVATSPDAIILTDLDIRIVVCNERAAQMVGVGSPQELVGRCGIEIIAPEDHLRLLEDVRTVLDRGSSAGVEFRLVRVDGERIPLEVSTSLVRGPEGQPKGLIIVARDISSRKCAEDALRRAHVELEERVQARTNELALATEQARAEVIEREHAEQALRTSEEQLRTLLEAAPLAILIAAPDGRITLVNSQTEEVFGYARDEMLGRDVEMLIPDEHREAHVRMRRGFGGTADALRIGVARELSARRKDGTCFPVEINLSPVRSPEGPLTIAAIRDISARKRAEAAQHDLIREQAAHAEAEIARQRFAFLAEASDVLASTLDSTEAFQGLTQLAVPVVADHCAVYLLGTDGRVVLLAQAHTGPRPAVSPDLPTRLPSVDDECGPGCAIRTGEPGLIANARANDAPNLACYGELARRGNGRGVASLISVPLTVRGQTVGALALATIESDRVYGDGDLALAQDLARRCAQSIENARLYHEAQAEVAERRRAEAALFAEKERLVVTLRSIGDGVISVDTATRILLVNPVAEAMTGVRQEEAIGRPLDDVVHLVSKRSREPVGNPVARVLETGRATDSVTPRVLISRSGVERIISDRAAPIRDEKGQIQGATFVFRDVTDKEKLDAEIQRAGKLESLGVLAGGIAHDFNNILTGILGNLSLAKLDVDGGGTLSRRISEAERATLRARYLTHQLLTFAKGGAPIRKPTSVVELVRESAAFVLTGGEVETRLQLSEALWTTKIDSGQVSQVIQNLILNAQQAMPRGGTLVVSAENVELPEAGQDGPADRVPLTPGPYVRLSVSDRGHGIPEEDLPKIFDPFFTTKQGGTGLGLATAYAIVTKHEGYIGVESRLGEGTTFSIYLPAIREQVSEERPTLQDVQGHGRVLVMDDEPLMRETVRELLGALGYDAVTARDGEEAIELYQQAIQGGGPFDAVILDLTVPGGMGGKAAIRHLREIDPGVRAIVSSGYSDDPVMAHHERYGFLGVAAKPYTAMELARALKGVIGAGAAQGVEGTRKL